MPLSIIRSEAGAVIQLVLVIGGLMLVLTIAATLLVSRSVSKSINTIVVGAKRFAEGDLKYQIEGFRTSELKELGNSLNAMALQLHRSLTETEWVKNQQAAILQSMPTGVIALDESKMILFFNRAAVEILGVPSDHDPRGRQLEEYIRDVDLSTYLESVSLEDADHHVELVVLGTDGSGRELVACVVPLSDDHKDIFGYLIMLDDVTKLRKLEGLRSDFSANVSHELRTPITAIKGYAEMLETLCLGGDKETQKCLDIILRNTERLEMIIEDLLSLATLDNQEGGTCGGVGNVEKIDLREVLSTVVLTCAKEADASKVKLVVEGADELLVVGSRQLLVQAYTNLVQNGIRYGATGGIVRICISRDGDMAVVAVADSGDGIPLDLQPRLFERFFRVDKGRSRSTGGTGLGLAIVKHVALVHGGSVSVESVLGQGATFEMRIMASK